MPASQRSVITRPARGLSLGLRLGVVASLIVVGVMGAVSGAQLRAEERTADTEREVLLRASLVPLVVELQGAWNGTEATRMIRKFHGAYVGQGHSDHHVTLRTTEGTVVATTLAAELTPPPELLDAALELSNPRLDARPLTLRVFLDGAPHAQAKRRRWLNWGIHLALTTGLIIALLAVAIRREVTVPLNRLMQGIRTMELGYWEDMSDPGGAWEIRRVAWRFGALGHELQRTVEHLVAAQQRASAPRRSAFAGEDGPWHEAHTSTRREPDRVGVDPEEAVLHRVLEQLGAIEPGDPIARQLARQAWDRHAPVAERLGLVAARNGLENAALRILDPTGFRVVARHLERNRSRLDVLAGSCGAELERTLIVRGIPLVGLQHRVKHAAGIWRKMQQKALKLHQVHDVLAMRIVVPTTPDCYKALGALHDRYDPIVSRFKDYIVAPKASGYRGLHSTVRTPDGDVFEVQIRSVAMHQAAGHGDAAHAAYRKQASVSAENHRPSSFWRLAAWLGLA